MREQKLEPSYCMVCDAPILDFKGNAAFHLAIHNWMEKGILKYDT